MFINEVLQELKRRKITQKELCDAVGLKEQTFTNWKKGNIPNIESAMLVIKYLGLSADKIYGITEDENKLTNEEQEVIRLFRKMDIKSREMVKAAMYTAAQNKSYSSDSSSEAG